MSRVYAVGGGSRWDESRNTSRSGDAPAGTAAVALASVAAFRAAQPELAKWIEQGAPRLTEREHLERFGEPFASSRPKRPNKTAS